MNQETNKVSKRHNTRALAVGVMYSLDLNKNLYIEKLFFFIFSIFIPFLLEYIGNLLYN